MLTEPKKPESGRSGPHSLLTAQRAAENDMKPSTIRITSTVPKGPKGDGLASPANS
jgi:hypothetical protein